MPHCIIEFSDPVKNTAPPAQLVDAVYKAAFQSGLFEGPDIKTRASAFAVYQTGAQVLDFVHVTVRLLAGRTEAQKAQLSKLILDALLTLKLSNTSLTVEVVDMERASYAKFAG